MLGEWTVRDLNVLRGVLGDVTSKDPLMLKLKIKSGIIINKIIRERKKSKKKNLKDIVLSLLIYYFILILPLSDDLFRGPFIYVVRLSFMKI